ncbi:MAG: hypothetical protein EOO02_19195 [Chitinophagaceae bacterium]|nr:MAG: hypothetical protein EOO02_19195 [Chitinophagaceae bacterium]
MLIPPTYKTIYVRQGRLTITIHYFKITAQDYQVFSGSPAFFSIMGTRDCIVCVFQELLETRQIVNENEPAGKRLHEFYNSRLRHELIVNGQDEN